LNDFLDLIRKKYQEADTCSLDSFHYPDRPEETIQTLPYLSTKIETDLYPVLPKSKDFNLIEIYNTIKKIHSLLLS
jgi:hypothetical protein